MVAGPVHTQGEAQEPSRGSKTPARWPPVGLMASALWPQPSLRFHLGIQDSASQAPRNSPGPPCSHGHLSSLGTRGCTLTLDPFSLALSSSPLSQVLGGVCKNEKSFLSTAHRLGTGTDGQEGERPRGRCGEVGLRPTAGPAAMEEGQHLGRGSRRT